jgi:hypothetical protein
VRAENRDTAFDQRIYGQPPGPILITGAVHIPLNNALENPGSPAAIHDLAGVVDAFEGPWVAWHAVRTIALVESFAALVGAVLVHSRDRTAAQHAYRSRS